MKPKISTVIITYNEETNIKDCLETIKWCDEVIIVDAFSRDKTVEISKAYTDRIFQREWEGYGRQRNFGLSQAANEWVFFMDADERASELLVSEIMEAVERNDSRYNGYYIPRRSFYLGKWIRHGEWVPDLKLRLIRKSKGRWSNDSVHERLILDGEEGYLKNPIYHYTYRNITHHLEKFRRYSTLFAQDAFNKGKNPNIYKILLRPFFRFISGYFLKQGFRDGLPGFVIAAMQSFEVFLRYTKLQELRSQDIRKKEKEIIERYRPPQV